MTLCFVVIGQNAVLGGYTVFSVQKSEMRSFKSNENIHKKKDGSYYVVLANKASPVTL